MPYCASPLYQHNSYKIAVQQKNGMHLKTLQHIINDYLFWSFNTNK